MARKILINGSAAWFSTFRNSPILNFHSIEDGIRLFSHHHNIVVNDQVMTVSSKNQYDSLADVMEPLCNIPYEEQLKFKFKWSESIVEKLGERLKKLNIKGNVFGCFVEPISPSPITEKYRNKDEFSIQYGVDGNPKTVGFFIGSPASSNVLCVPATHLSIVKDEHKLLATVYQSFIQSSALPASHKLDDNGCFRNFTVRSNSVGETMAIAVSHPAGRTAVEIENERRDMLNFFQEAGVMPTSFFHQLCKHFKCTHDQSPIELLHGKRYLTEKILGNEFRISPDSFFQINVKAAEILYEEIVRLANLKASSTLLDLCCGTGTISIIASKKARGCIGIETIKDAVHDARINALNNNIYNCVFIHGTVESKLLYALRDLDLASHLVAVVNPGRAGLNSKVMKLIRECNLIRTLMYVSCAAENPVAMRNFVELLKVDKKTKTKTTPFALAKIKPIDMFPHTKHCELILVFKR